jgi:PAS domain-containing protein
MPRKKNGDKLAVRQSVSMAGAMSNGAQKSQGDSEDAAEDSNRFFHSGVSRGTSSQTRMNHSFAGSSSLRLVDSATGTAAEIRFQQQAQVLALVEKIGGLGIWEIDPASRKLSFSDNLCKLLGYPPGTPFKDHEYWTMVHPVDRDEARLISTLAIHARSPYEYAARIYATDRSVHWHIMITENWSESSECIATLPTRPAPTTKCANYRSNSCTRETPNGATWRANSMNRRASRWLR